MRIREVVKALGGGVIIVLACASEKATMPALDDAATDGLPGVGDARADLADDVDCSVNVDGDYYAVKEYPGRTQDSLSRAAAVHCEAPALPGPTGFKCRTAPSVWVKDGSVAVYCGTSPGLKMRFIVPDA